MKTITVRANGDEWVNLEQVVEQLKNTQPTEWICFDTGAEGISLGHSGILNFINQWVKTSGHPADRVMLNNPNRYEKTQYQNINRAENHFLQLSGHYYTEASPIDTTVTKFGFFVGRHTVERNHMALDIVNHYQQHFIMSIMKNSYAVSPWSKQLQTIPSIDSRSVQEQYTGTVDTNLSLLNYYNKFQIEVVAETMCAGTTFFPTEKTFRPITGRRPFLIYGPMNFLDNLRQLGFKTYHECWSETYDQLQGLDRWKAMRSTIDSIISNGYDLGQAQAIADHNRKHLTNWHQFTMPKDMPRVINDC
jgi:hypothetical protein